MTHHPNTPASRTEEAVPSVASGQGHAGAVADLRKAMWLDPECAHAGACQSLRFKSAAPVAALAAREQEALNYSDDEMAEDSEAAERASRQEAPVASVSSIIDTIQPWTMEHLKAYPKAALEILNKRIAEANAAPTAALSPATVAQPVVLTDAAIDKHLVEIMAARDFPANGILVKSYLVTPEEIRELFARAQPCASQGCGGDGGEATELLAALRTLEGAASDACYAKTVGSEQVALMGLVEPLSVARRIIARADATLSTDKGDGGSKE